jgi:hypothetical protein
MKSTLDRLSPKEKEALALLYDTEGYTALKKLCTAEIDGLGKDALGASDMEFVKFCSGQAAMAKKIAVYIREAYKEVNKES